MVLMNKVFEDLVKEHPNLDPFLSRPVDTPFLSLLIAHQFRRGRARNTVTSYGTATPISAPYISGANRDLLYFYENRLALDEAEKTADEIFLYIQERKIDATLIVNELRENPDLSTDEKATRLERLMEIEVEIEKLAALLEKLSA